MVHAHVHMVVQHVFWGGAVDTLAQAQHVVGLLGCHRDLVAGGAADSRFQFAALVEDVWGLPCVVARRCRRVAAVQNPPRKVPNLWRVVARVVSEVVRCAVPQVDMGVNIDIRVGVHATHGDRNSD